MANVYRRRRFIVIAVFLLIILVTAFTASKEQTEVLGENNQASGGVLALDALNQLPVRISDNTQEYDRSEFGSGWQTTNGCDTRNIILYRDLKNPISNDSCQVTSGVLDDPYTGRRIEFTRGASTSSVIQIDHVVALSDAWQKGAQDLSRETRVNLANDPLELLAVDGEANQQKSGSDASKWLPPNKIFRCQYVARQIAVKIKYKLWVSSAENGAIKNVLSSCRYQRLPN